MRLLAPALLVGLLLGPLLARADSIRVALEGRTELGKAPPRIKIAIVEPIAGFELSLERSDGKTVKTRGGGKPGVTRVIELPQPEGKFRYRGALTVTLPNAETASMPLDFETEAWGPLKLTLDTTLEDVKARRLRFRLNRPIAKAQLTVTLDDGRVVFDSEINFNGEAPGTPLEVSWPEHEGRVMKVALVAHDTSTYFAGVESFPWQLDVPHEEVVFDSGQAKVRKDQEAKLDASFEAIADQVRRYGRFAPIKLYVVGHTDTVGDAASNRTLSVARAKSLAAAFRKRGLRVPIFYEGLGEDAPRVSTEDEQGEEANRRAEYILAVEPPEISGSAGSLTWRKL